MSLVSTPHQFGPHANVESRFAALEALYKQAIAEIAEMRARDALKTQFLSNISHDLRTPLTAIITHAEILRDEIIGPINERQHDSISGIINGGRQLLEMVGEILTYARGAAGQLQVAKTVVDLREVVQQLCAMNNPLISKKQIRFDSAISPAVPPVQADREKIVH